MKENGHRPEKTAILSGPLVSLFFLLCHMSEWELRFNMQFGHALESPTNISIKPYDRSRGKVGIHASKKVKGAGSFLFLVTYNFTKGKRVTIKRF